MSTSSRLIFNFSFSTSIDPVVDISLYYLFKDLEFPPKQLKSMSTWDWFPKTWDHLGAVTLSQTQETYGRF